MAHDTISIDLTRQELYDLFCRSLKSADEDTDASRSALQKLAKALESEPHERLAS
jgi:hypothetical protein